MKETGLVGKIVLIVVAGGLITLTVIIVKETPNSLPGDLVYPIKGIAENLKLAQHELEYAKRANVYLDVTQARLIEIEGLIKKRGRDKEIIATIPRLLDAQAKAISNLGRARTQNENIPPLFIVKLKTILQKEQQDLPELVFEVSQEAAEEIKKAIYQSNVDLERLNAMR